MHPDDRDELGALLERWFLRLEAGESPDPAAHCAARPDLLPEFVRLLGRSADVDRLFLPRADAAAPAEPFPERLGEFELLAPIGSGGVGDVYLARQTSLQRLVALKVLKPTGNLRSRQRLRREAEVAASLEHPGIVPIYGVGEDGDRAWIAMKWLTGPALDGLELPVDARRAARIGAAVARALHEAHVVGVVHRDIKPSNVVLDGDEPCIVDFGLARDAEHTVRTTLEGHVAGTLLYMSPEQLRATGSAVTLDARTDIYSLGATLHELLSGAPPFDEDNPAKVMDRILNTDPAPLDLERDLATIVLRAMEKDRERRFASALAMAEDLERFLAGEPILSRRSGLTTRVWKLARRNRVATALLAAAVLVALVLAVSLGWTVRQQAIARAAAVDRVAEEIDVGNLATARTLLEPLLAGADDVAPDLVALDGSLRACERLEELLDQVQSLPEDVHADDLRRAVAELDAVSVPPNKEVALRLVRPMALALAGDRDAAERLARALPSSRGRDALLAALTGQRGTWDLPDAEDPIEHLFTVLALRLADRPLPERRAEIELGRADHETDPRLRLQHAIQLINEGSHESAYEALGGVPRGEHYPRIVRRLLLREAVETERTEDARRHLAALRSDHPRETWTAADAAYALDAMYWLEEPHADLMRWARQRWPESWLLAMMHARALEGSDPARARELLEHSATWARTAQERQATELALLCHEAEALRDWFWKPCVLDPTPESSAGLLALAERAAELAAAAEDPAVAVSAAVIRARAALAAGDCEQAREALADLAHEDHPEVVIELAGQVWTRYTLEIAKHHRYATDWQLATLSALRAAAPGRPVELAKSARAQLVATLAAMPGSQSFCGRLAHGTAWTIAAGLALAERATDDAKVAIARARDHLPPDPEGWERRLLDGFEQQLGQ